MRLISDGYDRRARLYPAVILLAPVVSAVAAVTSVSLSAIQSAAATVIACGGSFLLAQLARDAGKSREPRLFALWGGIPSVVILRHRDTRIDSITKTRYHKRLSTLVKGTKPPSPAEEERDPQGADRIYQSWSTYVRVNTRDANKYSLLFDENVNYGYRRNLWGLRAWGITASSVAVVISAFWIVREYYAHNAIRIELVGATVLAGFFLVLWLFRFTSDWVRLPADAYAERLAEAIETLNGKEKQVAGAAG